MIRIDFIWLALGASDLRGGIDKLLAQVVHGFALGAQAHHAYVFANRRADRLKVLVFDGVGMWLCTRRLQAGSFEWPRDVLFDHILLDTAIEDRAAEEAKKPAVSPARAKGQAVRQALPASLPRIEHHHELKETHCACGHRRFFWVSQAPKPGSHHRRSMHGPRQAQAVRCPPALGSLKNNLNNSI